MTVIAFVAFKALAGGCLVVAFSLLQLDRDRLYEREDRLLRKLE
jgi:hypothetical protein